MFTLCHLKSDFVEDCWETITIYQVLQIVIVIVF
jgi:hypothetical protein